MTQRKRELRRWLCRLERRARAYESRGENILANKIRTTMATRLRHWVGLFGHEVRRHIRPRYRRVVVHPANDPFRCFWRILAQAEILEGIGRETETRTLYLAAEALLSDLGKLWLHGADENSLQHGIQFSRLQ